MQSRIVEEVKVYVLDKVTLGIPRVENEGLLIVGGGGGAGCDQRTTSVLVLAFYLLALAGLRTSRNSVSTSYLNIGALKKTGITDVTITPILTWVPGLQAHVLMLTQ